MTLRAQFAGAIREAHGLLNRGEEERASVAGVFVTVITQGVTTQTNIADAGQWLNANSVFHVLKTDLAGFTADTLENKELIFKGKKYRILPVNDNGVHFVLTCEAFNKGGR